MKTIEGVTFVALGIVIGVVLQKAWLREDYKPIQTVVMAAEEVVEVVDKKNIETLSEQKKTPQKGPEIKVPIIVPQFFDTFVIHAQIKLKAPKLNEYAIKQANELKSLAKMFGDVENIEVEKIFGRYEGKNYEIKEVK